jgi:hypothetical protein
MGRKSGSGSGMNNPDHIFWSLETIFLVFFGSGMEKIRIQDPEWKKVGSEIQAKHLGYATLGLGKSK